ncbi:hypothetical protein ID866_10658 [Astraeus odoratus]|nr:hypothetical protein ID866_10658 [Astraeus odoratus]
MPLETLEQINTRAAISNIDLNDRVNRDETVPPRHGGSAIVYEGTLSPQGQRVVVKSLRLSPSGDTAAIDHIVKSVLLWSELRHTNLVRVFGLVTKLDFAVSIILAYIPKGNAFDYVQNKDIDPRPIVS